VLLLGRLEARGPGKGLFGQGRPAEETSSGSTNSGYRSEVAGESTGGAVSGAAVFSYVPAVPPSPRWTAGRLSEESQRREQVAEFSNWGYSMNPDYWGVGYPRSYGGFPFWYATLGHANYRNPYHDAALQENGHFDYGLLIPPETNVQVPGDVPFYTAARAMFYAADYRDSLRDVEHTIIDLPRNLGLHEFHALVLFALGDYRKSAAVAHAVLNGGPGWDWTILQSFYQSPDVYTRQLRALEHSIAVHGDQPATRFLLAYHYLMLGYYTAAQRQLEQVAVLEPRDALAKNILAGLNRAPGVMPQSPRSSRGVAAQQIARNPVRDPTDRTLTPSEPVTEANGGSLVGAWTSHPLPEATIEATLEPQGRFMWRFKEGDRAQTFTGTYRYFVDSLVFLREDGQKMEGLVTMRGGDGFCFRLKKAEPNDPGLVFSK
jgi:tetratricopeptide (TPR) repeat protein